MNQIIRWSIAMTSAALALSSCAAAPNGPARFATMQPAYHQHQIASADFGAGTAWQRVRYDGWAGPGEGPGWNQGYGQRRNVQRLTIDSAVYVSDNGLGLDAARYVRHKCEGEVDCNVKAKTSLLGDPDIGARKRLVITYRCGDGPQRTASVPEKRKLGLDCD